MPVERYRRGRSYTRRYGTRADLAEPDAVRTVMDEMAACDFTVEGRLADAERRAIAHLRQAGKPVDPHGPPYGNPAWLRENERRSTHWYAINIVNTIRMLRKQIERGDVRLAVDLALDLGVLTTEARMVEARVGGSERGGAGTKDSEHRTGIEQRNAEWCASAIEEWAKPGRRWWGAEKIAMKIAPAQVRTCRRVIGHLKPK
jgi:hypothetical protein